MGKIKQATKKRSAAQPVPTEAPVQQTAIDELIELLNAHVAFARASLRFTAESLAAISKSLAGE